MGAAGLQCPACWHVHSLDEVGATSRFRCRGCHKLLSVPSLPARTAGAGAPAPASAGAVAPADAWEATAAGSLEPRPARPAAPTVVQPRVPVTPPKESPAPVRPPARAPGAGARPRPLPAPARMAVWLVALAVGFVGAAVPLRALGVVELDELIDAFAAQGPGRFAFLLLLLPLWAALSAGFAHAVLEPAARWRSRRAAGGRHGKP